MATFALYVQTGNGSKTYNGLTAATGLTLSTIGAPGDFSTSGLTFSTSSKNAGSYTSLVNGGSDPTTFSSTNVRTYAIGYNYGTYTINPLALTVTASSKPYDGTTAAALGTSGILSGDTVSLSGTGGFTSANVGNNIPVNVSGISLSGTDAGNYTVSNGSVSTIANITPRMVSLTGTRVYDTTSSAAASIFTLSNVVSGESLTLTGVGRFADKNVGSGKSVSVGPLALGNGTNGSASNYTLVGGTDTASITPASVTLSGLSAQDRVYDATTLATLIGTATLAGLYAGDSVSLNGVPSSGTFADKNVGSTKSVTANTSGLSLSGIDAGNYQLGSFTTPLTANITPATLTVSGLSAQNKVYDATTFATLSGTPILAGIYSGDSVTLAGSASTGTFSSKDVGNGKTVSANLGGLSISGAGAGGGRRGAGAAPGGAGGAPAARN